MRHDSLERNAYGVERNNLYGGIWTVVFRYRPQPEIVNYYGEYFDTVARAVTMDIYGGKMRVRHSDHSISYPLIKTREEVLQ